MSELSSRMDAEVTPREGTVAPCFCQQCSRVLYLLEAELLFCPVCSSLVSRIETDELNSGQGPRAAD